MTSSSLGALVDAPPTGRARPLLVDHLAYATAVIRQGAPVPWTDVAALTGHIHQVHALLNPDAVWLDVDALYDAHLATAPALREAMGARARAGYALRTLLADEGVRARLLTTARTLAESTRRPLVLSVPSPARWLVRAHAEAGTPLEGVGDDEADTASMYLAEWLGRLGELPVALVVLDARPAPGDIGDIVAEDSLDGYSALTNVAAHFEWSLLLRGAGGIAVPDDIAVAAVPDGFWHGEEPAPDTAVVLLASVPADARPEAVLERVRLLEG